MAEKVDQIAAEALQVSEEEFERRFAGERYEWVAGVAIPMSPSTMAHNEIVLRLISMFLMYIRVRAVAKLMVQSVTMRLELPEKVVRRDPDIMLLLNEHLDRVTPTYVNGPADLVIEVVSPESITRDHAEKFMEYEAGGVPEYWIIDPIHREARFLRLDAASGAYIAIPTAESYSTPMLPGLELHLADLWSPAFPDPIAIMESVQRAFNEE